MHHGTLLKNMYFQRGPSLQKHHWQNEGPGARMTLVSFSFILSDSSIKQLDPEDMDEIEKIEY